MMISILQIDISAQKSYQLDQFGGEAENTLSCLPPKLIKLMMEMNILSVPLWRPQKIPSFNMIGSQLKHGWH